MREVLLSGSLARKYGRRFQFDVASPAEAVRALCANFAGFESELQASESRGVRYAVFDGRENIGEDRLTMLGRSAIRIVPVLAGSKRGGILQTIIGGVLVVAGIAFDYFTFGSGAPFGNYLIMMGAAMILTGVVQLLTPIPKTAAAAAGNSSRSFSGPINITTQGEAVPVILGGPILVGSVVIGESLDADQLNVDAPVAALTASVSGLTVDFDASTSSPTVGSLASFHFDFGDGNTATQPAGSGTPLPGSQISHTYAAAGTYAAVLTVTNDQGYTSDPATLSVIVA